MSEYYLVSFWRIISAACAVHDIWFFRGGVYAVLPEG